MADETGTLLAGDICNTNVYVDGDAESARAVRSMFEEQVGWAVDAGVDFVIAETYSWGAEALMALEVDQAGRLAGGRHDGGAPGADVTLEGWTIPRPAGGSRRPARTSSA